MLAPLQNTRLTVGGRKWEVGGGRRWEVGVGEGGGGEGRGGGRRWEE